MTFPFPDHLPLDKADEALSFARKFARGSFTTHARYRPAWLSGAQADAFWKRNRDLIERKDITA